MIKYKKKTIYDNFVKKEKYSIGIFSRPYSPYKYGKIVKKVPQYWVWYHARIIERTNIIIYFPCKQSAL